MNSLPSSYTPNPRSSLHIPLNMLPISILLALMTSPTAQARADAEATPGPPGREDPDPPTNAAFFTTYPSKDILTYTIPISSSATTTTYVAVVDNIDEEPGQHHNEQQQQQQAKAKRQQQQYANDDEKSVFSATDAAGSVTILPGSIVPSDVPLGGSDGGGLPTTLVTATDASPTPPPARETTTMTLSSSSSSTPPWTWTVSMQNGMTKTVAVPPSATTNAEQSTQTTSVGLMSSPPVGLSPSFSSFFFPFSYPRGRDQPTDKLHSSGWRYSVL